MLRVRVASGWVGFCGVCALAMGWVAGICGAAEAGDAAPTPVPGVRAMRRAAITLADLKAQIPQSAAGQFVMELPQILHTAMDPEVLALMDGQGVETTGMMLGGVVTEGAGNGGNGAGLRVRIGRSQLQCCTDHAKQCELVVEFDRKIPVPPEKAWMRVSGRLGYERDGRRMVAVLRASQWKEIAVPVVPVLK